MVNQYYNDDHVFTILLPDDDEVNCANDLTAPVGSTVFRRQRL